MPQYSFSSIASLATSQKKETPQSRDENNLQQPGSGSYLHQPPGIQQQPPGFQKQPPGLQQQHTGFQQPQLIQPQLYGQQGQQPQITQQHLSQQRLYQPNQSISREEPKPSPIPTSLQQALTKPQNKPILGPNAASAKGSVEFHQTPVNEHEVDSANAMKEEQAQHNKLEGNLQHRNSLSPGSSSGGTSQEVRHTIVTLQPQVHPGKVPPIKISTRVQPTISPPKQEQLSDEEDSKANTESKPTDVISKEGEDHTSSDMDTDEVHRDGSRDIGTMTSTNMRTMLDGMVLTETQGGLLVLNVMYKNKEFVGTLMECTSPTHSWGAPRHSDIPAPDKKPKKKKKSKSEKLAPRIGLRNRRRMKRRDKREKRLSWDRTNRTAAKTNKRISF